ncbi:hypothetical protein C5E08_07160 [Rathayibacter iranicus]|uniref:Lasso peptide biosynthesis B2 protein n=2 Tax=Rathayibacter iranicus TaxID=59737 RepID=A0AAD1AIZ7_9MICO|nr:lasso peptide biosynthesis B2 protein [Rathayibacter iranicus]MWV31174.1 lasso peptide biosynthesis B2 protein [Rathayibacter iranicus NCPPB 2253 = VKM Ac-1602]AZZ57371.1 lasso peptide biosynthesis B2 protein [Rathayibacter iranicus]PPI47766.1 hypothetical protein C5E09_06225 [Rathayibacter iranicus]PPI61148.1 hypothetical protein C5E08_07160 [Rathayibacter iranicus]PPI73150.1 hypothetical protein C5E01_03495 [Rathayibacter iranicus]
MQHRSYPFFGLDARDAIAAARVISWLPPDRMQLLMRGISRGARPATIAQTQKARDIVCAPSRRCAGQGCVQRSIAVVVLCRMRSSSPNWRTGFGTEPFIAHAWVEADGQPVGEPEAVARYFVAHAVDVDLLSSRLA